MKAPSGISNPLLIPTGQAIAKLKSWHKAGNGLHDKVEKVYNANHFEASVDIAIIRKFLKYIETWFNNTSSDLKRIYINQAYVNRFLVDPFDKKWFALTPAILKDNLVQLYKTGNYRGRLSRSKPAEIKQIMKRIMGDIGSIEPHWNAEKDRMIATLHNRLKEGLDYLVDRIAFLSAFGEINGLILIEFDLLDTHKEILKVLRKEPIIMTEIEDNDYYERLFNEYQNTGVLNTESVINTKIDVLKYPKHKKYELEKRDLLKIYYDGSGEMVDSLSEGGPYWLNIFNERMDAIIVAKKHFNQIFHEIFGVSPSSFIPEWDCQHPEYNMNRSKESLAKLGEYGFEQLYLLASLPQKVIESNFEKRRDNEIKTKSKVPYAVRPETRRKYGEINRTFNRLKKEHSQYTNSALFKLVAEELRTTISTVKRAIYG